MPLKPVALLVVLLLSFTASCARADPKLLAGFAYEEVVRGAPEDAAGIPLIVALHYSAGSAREAFANYEAVDGPVRILVPLGEFPKRGGLSYFPVDYYELPASERFEIATEATRRLAAFLAAATELYGARPVVTGLSQGGDISLLLAVSYPETVTAAVPIAAVIPDALTVSPQRAALDGPCILMLQGEEDPVVNVADTRAGIARLKSGLPVVLRTYPGVGHDISPEMEEAYTAFIERALGTSGADEDRTCQARAVPPPAVP